MDTIRSPRPAADPLRVLLAGPDSWLGTVRPAFAESDSYTVRTAGTADRAVATATESDGGVDCVVVARQIGETTGLELLSTLRSSGVDVPFVVAPTDGGESLASDAIAAGVADYLPADADPPVLRRRCREAVERRAAERRRRDRADQFESLFAAPDRFVAVLDADGTVVRASEAALDYLGAEEDAVLGKRFWGLPWTDDETRPLQRAVGRARRGEYADFEAGLPNGDDERRFEFAVRPVTDDAGEVVRIVAEGREVAERVRLEEELRRSEELHRVTLNNMTDTVLVTDDEGAFTYVCPNVHFIFGYSAEEIYDLGTIDALLGEGLFDRDRLDDRGVLTNVECTATDKEGREHTLLVNVRRVSIQGGTTLFSCRDITKRKQRERALTQLHRTSRDLLYAETGSEIADRVASDAAAVLPSAAAAVYRFDRDRNALYPAAVTDELEARLGTPPDLRLDRDTAVGRAFIDGETRTRADGPDDSADRSDRPTGSEFLSALGDYVAVPLGDHGVFIAVATDDDSFDEVGEEVAELLAATTEAAFDRVARESELRERDRELQARNRRLTQLNRVNEFIREIDQALVSAESRERIETAVCERLTADDRFAFAWIGETAGSGRTLRPRAWAGDDRGYLDAVALGPEADAETAEPSVRAAREREAALVSNVADRLRADPWCQEAVSREFQSVLSIPLAYDGVLFGTLSVYADSPDAFDEMVRSVLCELGDTVASAINAVQRKEALESDAVVELEYRSADAGDVLHRLARETGASLAVAGDVVRDDDTTLVFATVATGDPADGVGDGDSEGTGRSRLDAVVATAEELVDVAGAEVIRESDDGGLVGLRLRGDFVATVLADHGAALDRMRATPDGLSLTLVAPRSVGTRAIDEVVSNAYDDAELVAQRERTRPTDATRPSDRFRDDLTERQLEVAQTAYHAGFFDADRDVTGRDVASMLDVSHTAFYDHVRRVQRKLFASLFEGRPRPAEVE
ncbi:MULTISPECIES: bacterio-opsin activator domain-containing protein [Halorussus]|uniref:bacterio-opsin activator domain-containing protein n=1 Tax=Halorussus TaxID=1070314 RepID=UPI000E20F656|nr:MULTISPECIES: bacterio-opsin activator domain-containing protein [Halorussus]NHN59409.1 PAS domain S-box protein [Halorussus sp. JP-T4]